MNSNLKRVLFVAVFVSSFVGLSFLCLMLAISADLGPSDAPATLNFRHIISEIAGVILTVLWFPLDVIHEWLFKGQSFPGDNWLWISACGLLYAVTVMLLIDLFGKRKKNRLTNRSTRTRKNSAPVS